MTIIINLKFLIFLKKKGYFNFEYFFDVGAHKGESLKLFLNNFKIKNIYSFEPSHINFLNLKKMQKGLRESLKIQIY